jgi:ribose transport system ATP-binding protein
MTEPQRPPVLEVRGLSKTFPGTVALDRVGLTVRAHEVHALIGENGAGKSTLMRILAGALAADAGEVLMDGAPVRLRSPADSRRLGISIVPQDISLAPNLCAAENMYVGAELRWGPIVNRALMHEAAVAVLERIGAKFDPRTPVWQLDTAQRQLVVIARALALEGRVLVLDEPTSSLAARDSETLLDVLCQLREQGMAILYISHRLSEIYALSDRVSVLHDGRLLATLAGEEIGMDRVIRLMSHGAAAPEPARTPRPAQPMAPLLQVRALSDGERLAPVSLQVARGEVLGLTGLVGSGRSRLARLLCGAGRKRSGEVRLDGRACDFHAPADALQLGIAYMPENRVDEALFPRMSPRDNVVMCVVSLYRKLGLFCDEARLEQVYLDVKKRLQLELPDSDVWAAELSSGMQKKLLLARSLITQPRLLILDEPTVGLDAASHAAFETLVRELADAGMAVVWVSADVPEVLRVSDRVLVMCDGEVTGTLDPARGDAFTEDVVLAYATGLRRDDLADAG